MNKKAITTPFLSLRVLEDNGKWLIFTAVKWPAGIYIYAMRLNTVICSNAGAVSVVEEKWLLDFPFAMKSYKTRPIL